MIDDEHEDKVNTADNQEPSILLRAITYPLRKSFGLAYSIIRPWSPQLIPLAACVVLLPLILTFSSFAGFYVWKNAATGWEVPVYLQYGDGIMPFADITIPGLVAHQPYDVSLHMVVPTSQSNLGLGNFMVSLVMANSANTTSVSVRRSGVVLAQSHFSLSNIWTQSGTVGLHIPLLEPYLATSVVSLARLHIGRNDNWSNIGSGEGRELAVSSASLVGRLRHEGVRGLVTRFPLLFSILAAVVFFLVSSATLAAMILPLIITTPTIDEEIQPVPATHTDSMSEEEKPLERIARTTGNRRMRGEPPISDIPTTGPTPPNPLRRRQSRTTPDSDSD